MSTCTPDIVEEESKNDQPDKDDLQLLIVTLKSIKLVEKHLDEINLAMRQLRNQAVKTYQENSLLFSENQIYKEK